MAVRNSYRLIAVLAWGLFIVSMFATKWEMTVIELRHVLETFSMLIVAYAFILPFTFLAWSINPLTDE